MLYGISKSKDILLSSISDALNETTKKSSTIDRLSDNLAKNLPLSIDNHYTKLAIDALGKHPIFLVDDSDIIKPLGEKFEDLGIVRDGSSRKKSFEKGYHHTEIVGLTEKRKVFFKGKWYKITTLCDSRKGKVKMAILFQGEKKECYVSVLRTQITADKKWIYSILVYGLSDTPMMLASNLPIKSKEDIIKTTRSYLDRWRIEEYFKFKKQEYHFENFRVRSLKAMNNLNKMLTYAIGLIALLCEKMDKSMFVKTIIKESRSLKDKVHLWFYQMARGIYHILMNAKTGIRDWQQIQKYDGQISLF